MTNEELRALALSFPYACEKPHFERASFRVDLPKGKIFATLLEADQSVNLMLTPDEQAMLVHAEPELFSKIPNKWGDQGATTLALPACDDATARSVIAMAWRHAVPPRHLKDIET